MVTQRKNRLLLFTVILGMAGILNSCSLFLPAGSSVPPLVHSPNPIIIVPGIMGSMLTNPETDEIIWGKMLDLRVANPHEALLFPELDGVELPVDSTHTDGLVASNILSRFEMLNRLGSVTVYEDLIQSFSNCGLVEGDIQRCSGSDNIYLFSYDWRQDLVQTALLLAERIEAVIKASGPGTKVTLVTHSMGGLIAQYYLMYGGQDVLDKTDLTPDYSGARNVEKVFFLGMPFKGTPMAFKSIHSGEWIGPGLTISKWATFTMPAIYELLPFADQNLFVDDHNQHLAVDLTSVVTWRDLGFSIFQQAEWSQFEQTCQISFPDSGPELAHDLSQHYQTFFQSALDRGVSFQHTLKLVEWDRIPTEVFLVIGDCEDTLAQIRLIDQGSQKQTRIVRSRFLTEHYWLSKQGDGVVLESAADAVIGSAEKVLTGCFQHRTMPNQPEVIRFIIDNL